MVSEPPRDDLLDNRPAARPFEEEDGAPLVARTRAGLGYCAPEPFSVTLWGIVFHLSLFATFFFVFFQFALKPKYTHSQEKLGNLLAALSQSRIDQRTVAVAAQVEDRQADLATKALAIRQRGNDRLLGAAAVPVAALWILTIGWGVMIRDRGLKVLPTMRGACLMFVAFLVAEILIFVFVVKKYSPLDGHDLVEIYKKAFAKRLASCDPTTTTTTTSSGGRLPVNRITDALLGRVVAPIDAFVPGSGSVDTPQDKLSLVHLTTRTHTQNAPQNQPIHTVRHQATQDHSDHRAEGFGEVRPLQRHPLPP